MNRYELFSNLSDQEIEICNLYYGFDQEPQDLRSVSNTLGINPVDIYLIHTKIIEKLKLEYDVDKCTYADNDLGMIRLLFAIDALNYREVRKLLGRNFIKPPKTNIDSKELSNFMDSVLKAYSKEQINNFEIYLTDHYKLSEGERDRISEEICDLGDKLMLFRFDFLEESFIDISSFYLELLKYLFIGYGNKWLEIEYAKRQSAKNMDALKVKYSFDEPLIHTVSFPHLDINIFDTDIAKSRFTVDYVRVKMNSDEIHEIKGGERVHRWLATCDFDINESFDEVKAISLSVGLLDYGKQVVLDFNNYNNQLYLTNVFEFTGYFIPSVETIKFDIETNIEMDSSLELTGYDFGNIRVHCITKMINNDEQITKLEIQVCVNKKSKVDEDYTLCLCCYNDENIVIVKREIPLISAEILSMEECIFDIVCDYSDICKTKIYAKRRR